VRAANDPQQLAATLRGTLRETDPTLAPFAIAKMDDVVDRTTADPRFNARLLGAFAVLALILAIVGTYSVLAYSVAQRTHEIGVRMALGARGRTVVWMVLQRTLMFAAAGVIIGAAGAAMTTRLLRTLLFATTPTDAPTFIVVTLVILTAAVAAGLLPARRATRVDPLVALRHE
jgi:putative ABC transport system permease protein